MSYHKIQESEWKSYNVEIGIGTEWLNLFVPKAIDAQDAINQVMQSDNLSHYDEEDFEDMEIISVREEDPV